MFQILLITHVIITVGIIGLVMIQHGKGADAGAAFGAGASASGTVFGAQGAGNFLSRTTAILAVMFFATSLTLAWLSSQREAPKDIMGSVTTEQMIEAPGELPTLPLDNIGTPAGGLDVPAPEEARIPE